ncbi:pyridoxal phosphate-dependent aminotransferase [Couchioplanes azureus]|uniref:pyridoxal phosphate-dependent aminotransferase n=1 Tax=Couchioplanes caeruleus TaxID=56438 RepID=UPI00199EF56A|nr:histidinol-phosphate transaminase [Couchioplanes caeruleus]GGQ76966.1 putative phenylalanine aminotransferase [Couchioplanes caeruleus subsp. azureus]
MTFEVLEGAVSDLADRALSRYGGLLRRMAGAVRWELDVPMLPGAGACEHGGASFDALGADFATLHRRHEIVAADVLDAWFPPAPGVVAALAEDPAWSARTSPPTGAEGLVAEIATRRGLAPGTVAVGAGSSDLIFRAFRGWLDPTSSVLLVDPSYGEYAHVVSRVAGCRVRWLPVRRADGWRIDPDALRAALRDGPDLVVLVNPNNPTGRLLPAGQLRRLLDEASERTRVWVDEAYVDYAGAGQSLEAYAAGRPNVVVCKSLSKAYALSGMRAAYLVAAEPIAAEIRRWTPPWAVSLPAQLAAVRALQDPRYYAGRWAQTATLRAELAAGLAGTGPGVEVEQALANFVLMTLPPHGPGAPRLVRECRRHGVFLRDLSPVSPAFEGRTVRVAVRDTAANARIVDVVAEALRTLSPAGSPRAGAAPGRA